ncbi:MAG: 3-methyl-2-oxobutanoate hydroxymethyltransferase [Candidatus Asgardarchaeia archaeon]
MSSEKISVRDLLKMKKRGEKISMITSYDYPTALLVDEAGIDVILVGDSLGMVVLGYENTLPVTVDDIIHHTKPVVRAVKRALVVADMPFMSFHTTPVEALKNAGRIIKETGADSVKIEGGIQVLDVVEKLVDAGIPVMGHIGLTPQKIKLFGRYRVRGKKAKEAMELVRSAKELEKAGVFAIVLELIPAEISKIITESLSIPTIGIGAGPYCDGQVLVFHDMFGLFMGFKPKFAKVYADVGSMIKNGVKTYVEEVKSGKFPTDEHSFHAKREEIEALMEELKRED